MASKLVKLDPTLIKLFHILYFFCHLHTSNCNLHLHTDRKDREEREEWEEREDSGGMGGPGGPERTGENWEGPGRPGGHSASIWHTT